MKRNRLEILLCVLWFILIIVISISLIIYYNLKNIDDSRCPEWMYLQNPRVSNVLCNDCSLTKKQYESWKEYVVNDKCRVREKTCYICVKLSDNPDCKRCMDGESVSLKVNNDLIWYSLRLINYYPFLEYLLF
jgi:hypothetical protein